MDTVSTILGEIRRRISIAEQVQLGLLHRQKFSSVPGSILDLAVVKYFAKLSKLWVQNDASSSANHWVSCSTTKCLSLISLS